MTSGRSSSRTNWLMLWFQGHRAPLPGRDDAVCSRALAPGFQGPRGGIPGTRSVSGKSTWRVPDLHYPGVPRTMRVSGSRGLPGGIPPGGEVAVKPVLVRREISERGVMLSRVVTRAAAPNAHAFGPLVRGIACLRQPLVPAPDSQRTRKPTGRSVSTLALIAEQMDPVSAAACALVVPGPMVTQFLQVAPAVLLQFVFVAPLPASSPGLSF